MIKLIAILMLTILWSVPAFATSCGYSKNYNFDAPPRGDLIVKAKIIEYQASRFGDDTYTLRIFEMHRGPADMPEYFTAYRMKDELLDYISLSKGSVGTYTFNLEDDGWRVYAPLCAHRSQEAWAAVKKIKLPFNVGASDKKEKWYDFLINR